MRSIVKRVGKILLPVLACILGIGMVAYPAIGNYLHEISQTQAYAVYEEQVSNTEGSKLEEALAAAEEYNRHLYEGTATGDVQTYDAQLNLNGNGVMGYLSIPCIGIRIPVLHGVENETMMQGAGHLPNSSLPVGGPSTHCILSAHSGVADKRLFTDLEQVTVGDTFTLSVCGRNMTYQVDQIRVVLPHEADGLGITDGADYVTLITCTPYGINTHRLLVRGVRVENPETAETEEPAQEQDHCEPHRLSAWTVHYLIGIAIGLGAALSITVAAVITIKRRRSRHA